MPTLMDKLNGRARFWGTLGAAAIFLVTTTVTVENRYAKAGEMEAVQESADKIVTVLTLSYQSRKTILKLRQAQGTITPEEQVELGGIEEILVTLIK